jgi:hypothetical protein
MRSVLSEIVRDEVDVLVRREIAVVRGQVGKAVDRSGRRAGHRENKVQLPCAPMPSVRSRGSCAAWERCGSVHDSQEVSFRCADVHVIRRSVAKFGRVHAVSGERRF